MAEATSYEEWTARALAEDRRSGADLWKQEEPSDLYDYRVIRRRYDELAEIRKSGDAQRLLYYLNEGMHGNMGGMGSPALYAYARFGTKALIVQYVDELVSALRDMEEMDEAEIPFREKLDFFRRASATWRAPCIPLPWAWCGTSIRSTSTRGWSSGC